MKRLQVNNIQIYLCDTPEQLIALWFGWFGVQSFDKIADKTIGYYSTRYRKHKRVKARKFLDYCIEDGSWGFAQEHTIYIWHDGHSKIDELSAMLSHEYGHLNLPLSYDAKSGERQAEQHEQCDKFVSKVMKKLGYQWRKTRGCG